MGKLAAVEAKVREFGYDGDGYMVVRVAIAAEIIVHITTANMHIDYDATFLLGQSMKARKYADLVPRTKLIIMDVQQLYIALNS